MVNLFISYVVQMDNGNFYGDAVITTNKVLRNVDDVNFIRGVIEEDLKEKGFNYTNVFIQNWIVMDQ